MKRVLTLLWIGCTLLCRAATYAPVDVPDPKQWGQDNYVSNPDSVLSDEVVADLNLLCRKLEKNTGVELAVVAIGDIGDYVMFDFGFELFQRWGIGKEGQNTGVLITLAHDIHEVYINTGTGIEGVLPDATCSSIIYDDMIPYFRDDDYDGGIMMGAMHIYEICTHGDAPEELLNMRSVTNRGGYTTASVRAENKLRSEHFEKFWWLYVCIGIFAILFPFLVGVLIQGKKQDSIDELQQRAGCLTGLVVLCIICPFAIPATLWFGLRARNARCPHCGRRKFRQYSSETLVEATYTHAGKKRVDYRCMVCGYEDSREVPIAQKTVSTSSSSSSSSSWDSSSSSGSWGGSSSSGSWGGGSSSGGGAGGKW